MHDLGSGLDPLLGSATLGVAGDHITDSLGGMHHDVAEVRNPFVLGYLLEGFGVTGLLQHRLLVASLRSAREGDAACSRRSGVSRTLQSILADDLFARARCECVIGLEVDVLGNPANRAICQYELSSRFVVATEIIQLTLFGVIRRIRVGWEITNAQESGDVLIKRVEGRFIFWPRRSGR